MRVLKCMLAVTLVLMSTSVFADDYDYGYTDYSNYTHEGSSCGCNR